MEKIKIGVIIGRFQSKKLHDGHIALYNAVKEVSDHVIIVLGSAYAKITKKNPIDYKVRTLMLQGMFPDSGITIMRDFGDDKKWSDGVDKAILDYLKTVKLFNTSSPAVEIPLEFEVTLYGCRDSFKPHYFGQFPAKELLDIEVVGVSATQERKEIANNPIDSEDFRAGIIYGRETDYNSVNPTIDIVPIKDDYKTILLGRKPFEEKFRFIGGFADVKDLSYEAGALRELKEEAGEDLIVDENIDYIGSMKVLDWRYEGTGDGIMTSFYLAKYISGEPKASDDIKECKWVNIDTFQDSEIVPEHLGLLNLLKKYLKKHNL